MKTTNSRRQRSVCKPPVARTDRRIGGFTSNRAIRDSLGVKIVEASSCNCIQFPIQIRDSFRSQVVFIKLE